MSAWLKSCCVSTVLWVNVWWASRFVGRPFFGSTVLQIDRFVSQLLCGSTVLTVNRFVGQTFCGSTVLWVNRCMDLGFRGSFFGGGQPPLSHGYPGRWIADPSSPDKPSIHKTIDPQNQRPTKPSTTDITIDSQNHRLTKPSTRKSQETPKLTKPNQNI